MVPFSTTTSKHSSPKGRSSMSATSALISDQINRSEKHKQPNVQITSQITDSFLISKQRRKEEPSICKNNQKGNDNLPALFFLSNEHRESIVGLTICNFRLHGLKNYTESNNFFLAFLFGGTI